MSLFNLVMLAFSALMVWLALYRRVHTGLLGSLGLLGTAIASLMTLDDSMLNGHESVEKLLLVFVGCGCLIVAHVLMRRPRRGSNKDGPTGPAAFDDMPHHLPSYGGNE